MALNAIYLSRGSSKEAREKVVEQIMTRQDEIEASNGELRRMMVFTEGVTSNGSHLLKFKKGAFIGEKRVRPLVIKVDLGATISTAYDVATVAPIAFLQMSWLWY